MKQHPEIEEYKTAIIEQIKELNRKQCALSITAKPHKWINPKLFQIISSDLIEDEDEIEYLNHANLMHSIN